MGCLVLGACATNPLTEDASAGSVMVGGHAHIIRPLTASTWTATPVSSAKAVENKPADAAALLQAIEKMSGCKVTDSHYSSETAQLDGQVDCGSRLKN